MTDQQHQGEERAIRLASIVSVDVVGFSTLSERNQRKAARIVEALRGRITRIADVHGGRLFNTAGDGFMLEFASAGAALGAVQDILDKRARGEPRLRVGAHVGDVIVTSNDDLLGHGVNVAARLQEMAEPGSALVSAEFRSMAHASPTAAFLARGQRPLENIEQRVQTFEILSRRQKFARFMRRLFWIVVAIAAIAGLVYAALYWGFNRYGWRWLDKLLGIPNLGGSWTVTGQSLTLEGEIKFDWSGTLTITQKWDRIAIELKTAQSGSFSETASVLLKHDGAAKLSYSYQNHPRAGEPELQKHQGFCELTFDIDRSRAEGHYFNSLGRYSFGRMTLTRAAAPS